MVTSKLDRLYNSIDSSKTTLCVGPMSFSCIDAVIEVANENQIPIILIPSRRQVECKELGGGYVTDTQTFAKYVREKDKGDWVFIERDHGGLFQGNDESSIILDKAVSTTMDSYVADVDAGFDILEIDCSLKTKDLNDTLFYNRLMYDFCENIREQENYVYEFEFEEHSLKKTNEKDFENVLNYLSRFKINNIKFLVGNVGLYVREMENVGKVDFDLLRCFTELSNSDAYYFKMHNCDFLDTETLKKINQYGVAAINVAPEFGVVETKELLNQLKLNNMLSDYEKFIEIAYKSNKWEKWLKSKFNKYLSNHSPLKLAILSGHYVFNDIRVLEIKQRTQEKFDLESILKHAVKEKIKYYLRGIGWSIK